MNDGQKRNEALRLEPEIGGSSVYSIAISTKRIADALERLEAVISPEGIGKLISQMMPIIDRIEAEENTER